jgi:hypothetical protein
MNFRDATLTTLETPIYSWGLPKGIKFCGTHSNKKWPFIVDLYFTAQRYFIHVLKWMHFEVQYKMFGCDSKEWYRLQIVWARKGSE